MAQPSHDPRPHTLRNSDYLTARGADPLTGLIAPTSTLFSSNDRSQPLTPPPSPTRATAPYPDLSPRKRPRFARSGPDRSLPPGQPRPQYPQSASPRDNFTAMPLVMDDPPLRGTGVRVLGPRPQSQLKPDEMLCGMRVPHKERRPAAQPTDAHSSPGSTPGKRNASLPMLATKLHLTPPPSPDMGGGESAAGGEDCGGAQRTSTVVRHHRPAHRITRVIPALLDQLPRVRLVHPTQAATPKARRHQSSMPFADRPLVAQQIEWARAGSSVPLDPKRMLFWVLIGIPGMLTWEAWQFLQRGLDEVKLDQIAALVKKTDRPDLRLVGLKRAAMLALRLAVALTVLLYTLKVLAKVGETITALAWPFRLLWKILCSLRRR